MSLELTICASVILLAVCNPSSTNETANTEIIAPIKQLSAVAIGENFLAYGTLHVEGEMILPNKTVVIPVNGVYWPNAFLSNPENAGYNEMTRSIRLMVKAFYGAISGDRDSANIKIDGYRKDPLRSDSATAVNYEARFILKNDTHIRQMDQSKTFQDFISNATLELAQGNIEDLITWNYVHSFSWSQVFNHEIRQCGTANANTLTISFNISLLSWFVISLNHLLWT